MTELKSYGDLGRFILENKKLPLPIALSGATGFLGSNFLFWFLQQGGRAHALVRYNTNSTPLKFIQQLEDVSFCNQFALPDKAEKRLRLVSGDILKKFCGLSQTQIKDLRDAKIHEFWHIAAENSGDNSELTRETNVQGTSNAINLAHKIGAQFFIYISDAYARLYERAENINYYKTKLEAERIVVSECEKLKLKYVILKPSFLIGKFISDQRRPGIYELLEILLQNNGKTSNIPDISGCQLNLMPVSQAVYDMLYLKHRGFQNGSSETLCNPSYLDLYETIKIINSALAEGYKNDSIINNKSGIGITTLPMWLKSHKPLLNKGHFTRTLPAHSAYNFNDLFNHVSEWIIWKRAQSKSFLKIRLLKEKNVPGETVFFTAGKIKNPPIVLINGYEHPVEIFFPLIQELSKKYYLVTWEPRGLPKIGENIGSYPINSDQQTLIFEKLHKKLNLGSPCIVGWCSGAQIALKILARDNCNVKKAVLLNNCLPITLDSPIQYTEYVQQLKNIFLKIRKDPWIAEAFSSMFFSRPSIERKEPVAVNVPIIFKEPSQYLQYLISAPYKTPYNLCRYSAISLDYWDEAKDNWQLRSKIRQPLLVYTTTNDPVSHPNASRDVSDSIPGSALKIEKGGGHFEHFTCSKKIAAIIGNFFH